MYPHRIHLREPWQREELPGLPGHRRFRRRFGYPGRLDEHERVWLTFAGVAAPATIALNGRPFGEGQGAFEFEVTGDLLARNELVADVPSRDAALFGVVALEIRASAFLHGVRFGRRGTEVVV